MDKRGNLRVFNRVFDSAMSVRHHASRVASAAAQGRTNDLAERDTLTALDYLDVTIRDLASEIRVYGKPR